MLVREQIERKLVDGLAPTRLEIIDESARHSGHAGAHPEGESHFSVEIVSPAFDGKSMLARQRMVYDLLVQEMRQRVHALSLKALTPAEESARNA